MGRKKKHTRTSEKIKQVSRRLFEETVNRVLTGELSLKKAATVIGFSEPTFVQRFRQYTEPEMYGGVPKDFFIEDLPKRPRKPKQEPVEKIELPDLSRFI